MRHCPECRTTYTDDSLKFCLSDGTRLADGADEEQTVVRSRSAERQIGSPARTDDIPAVRAAFWVKLLIALAILGFVGLGAIGLAGAWVYYKGGPAATPTPLPPAPKPASTPTPDLEKQRLQDELANIKKQLDAEKKNANSRANDGDDELGSSITATVDSPNDGFLALRSEPDPERGERLAKIPHGAEVEILRCGNSVVTIGGRSGHWCFVDYDGRTGWVFDAWLEY